MIKLIKRLISWSLLGFVLVVGILTYQLLDFQHGEASTARSTCRNRGFS
jgi:hypothetical protein